MTSSGGRPVLREQLSHRDVDVELASRALAFEPATRFGSGSLAVLDEPLTDRPAGDESGGRRTALVTAGILAGLLALASTVGVLAWQMSETADDSTPRTVVVSPSDGPPPRRAPSSAPAPPPPPVVAVPAPAAPAPAADPLPTSRSAPPAEAPPAFPRLERRLPRLAERLEGLDPPN